jgi:hypothetical protein
LRRAIEQVLSDVLNTRPLKLNVELRTTVTSHAFAFPLKYPFKIQDVYTCTSETAHNGESKYVCYLGNTPPPDSTDNSDSQVTSPSMVTKRADFISTDEIVLVEGRNESKLILAVQVSYGLGQSILVIHSPELYLTVFYDESNVDVRSDRAPQQWRNPIVHVSDKQMYQSVYLFRFTQEYYPSNGNLTN